MHSWRRRKRSVGGAAIGSNGFRSRGRRRGAAGMREDGCSEAGSRRVSPPRGARGKGDEGGRVRDSRRAPGGLDRVEGATMRYCCALRSSRRRWRRRWRGRSRPCSAGSSRGPLTPRRRLRWDPTGAAPPTTPSEARWRMRQLCRAGDGGDAPLVGDPAAAAPSRPRWKDADADALVEFSSRWRSRRCRGSGVDGEDGVGPPDAGTALLHRLRHPLRLPIDDVVAPARAKAAMTAGRTSQAARQRVCAATRAAAPEVRSLPIVPALRAPGEFLRLSSAPSPRLFSEIRPRRRLKTSTGHRNPVGVMLRRETNTIRVGARIRSSDARRPPEGPAPARTPRSAASRTSPDPTRPDPTRPDRTGRPVVAQTLTPSPSRDDRTAQVFNAHLEAFANQVDSREAGPAQRRRARRPRRGLLAVAGPSGPARVRDVLRWLLEPSSGGGSPRRVVSPTRPPGVLASSPKGRAGGRKGSATRTGSCSTTFSSPSAACEGRRVTTTRGSRMGPTGAGEGYLRRYLRGYQRERLPDKMSQGAAGLTAVGAEHPGGDAPG